MTNQEGLGCQCEKLREALEILRKATRMYVMPGTTIEVIVSESLALPPCPPPSPKDEAVSDEVREQLEYAEKECLHFTGNGCSCERLSILAAEVRRLHALLKAQGRDTGKAEHYEHGPFCPGKEPVLGHLLFCSRCHYEECFIIESGQKCRKIEAKLKASGESGVGK